MKTTRRGRCRSLAVATFFATLTFGFGAGPYLPQAKSAPRLTLVDGKVDPDLFVWTDTTNVYVLRSGDTALLFNIGDGSVLDRLPEIGVRHVQWVLLTDHHREQLQGAARLAGRGIRVGGPEAERTLFEAPSTFRRMKPRLNDRYTVHGSSYVRPPVDPVRLDRGLKRMDTFAWGGREILCVETPGNSPGGMSYLFRRGQRWVALSGDVMLAESRMHTWFDSEWDYGFGAGLRAQRSAVATLAGYTPILLLPSHGPVVRDAAAALALFDTKLATAGRLLARGYDVEDSAPFQDRVSRPTAVPFLSQISPHLYKLKGPNLFANFALIVSDTGRGLLVDAGLIDKQFLDRTLDLARDRLGLKGIDAVVVSHMHGDHFLDAPHLRARSGTEIWALDRMVPQLQRPEDFDYAASVESYGAGFDRVKVDRVLRSGEVIDWEGFRFTVDWMPGQTEFAMCLHGRIDGRLVAFTGDHIFADPQNPAHDGHEALVSRNSGILDEGYILGADYLARLNPDLIVGGHSYVMDRPAELIKRYGLWARRMREALQALSPDPDYRRWFDPFWVRAEPYRVHLVRGGTAQVQIHVRNFRDRPQRHRIVVHLPQGLVAEPPVVQGELAASARGSFPIRLRATQTAKPGVGIAGLDVTLDGQRYGERFDFVFAIE